MVWVAGTSRRRVPGVYGQVVAKRFYVDGCIRFPSRRNSISLYTLKGTDVNLRQAYHSTGIRIVQLKRAAGGIPTVSLANANARADVIREKQPGKTKQI
jgi:hypothetical protein